MKKAVFLDRDGVVNKTKLVDGCPVPPNCVEEVEILEGVVEAISMLMDNNYLVVVITNQPDVARGRVNQSQVDEINSLIGKTLEIDHIYTCPHDDNDFCECRKPAPGLIKRAASELGIDISKSFFVGDRWKDISASHNAGCQAFFIDYSYPEQQPQMPFTRVFSLIEAAKLIVRGENARE
jgi:D-glycero-D-manno-heptose 1,7-bisphosphate phosphatase